MGQLSKESASVSINLFLADHVSSPCTTQVNLGNSSDETRVVVTCRYGRFDGGLDTYCTGDRQSVLPVVNGRREDSGYSIGGVHGAFSSILTVITHAAI